MRPEVVRDAYSMQVRHEGLYWQCVLSRSNILGQLEERGFFYRMEMETGGQVCSGLLRASLVYCIKTNIQRYMCVTPTRSHVLSNERNEAWKESTVVYIIGYMSRNRQCRKEETKIKPTRKYSRM